MDTVIAHDTRDMIRASIEIRLSMKIPTAHKFAFTCMEDAVKKHGAFFPFGVALPASQMRELKQCFANSQGMAHGLDDQPPRKAWTYVEGYAVRRSLGFPMHHGWLIDEDGTVTDPTWRDLQPDEAAYFGIPIRPDYLKRHIARCFKAGEWRSILDDWQNGFRVLTGKDPMNTVAWPVGRFAKAERMT